MCAAAACTSSVGRPGTQTCFDDRCQECIVPPVEPAWTVHLGAEATELETAPDGSAYVGLNSAPWLLHYSAAGVPIVVTAPAEWDASVERFTFGPDGSIYVLQRLGMPDTVSFTAANDRTLHLNADGTLISATDWPVGTDRERGIAQAPNGDIFVVGDAFVPSTQPFIAKLNPDGSLGDQVPYSGLPGSMAAIAVDGAGNFAFAAGQKDGDMFTSETALLMNGASSLVILYQGTDQVGGVAADGQGGWWYSTGEVFSSSDGVDFAPTMYHADASGKPSTVQSFTLEPTKNVATADVATSVAALADSGLLVATYTATDQMYSVNRYTPAGLADTVDIEDAVIVTTADPTSAYVLTVGQTLARIDFAPLSAAP